MYDWWSFCHREKLCDEPTLASDRLSLCRSLSTLSSKERMHRISGCDDDFGYGPWFQNATASGVLRERGTNQFAASALFNYRLSLSTWRTLDPEKASLFYIPYDAYMDAYQFSGGNKYFSEKLNWVKKHVLTSPWFLRNAGADHFLILSAVRQFCAGTSSLLDNVLVRFPITLCAFLL